MKSSIFAELSDNEGQTWRKMNTLNMYLMPPRTHDLYFHFVSEDQDGRRTPSVTPRLDRTTLNELSELDDKISNSQDENEREVWRSEIANTIARAVRSDSNIRRIQQFLDKVYRPVNVKLNINFMPGRRVADDTYGLCEPYVNPNITSHVNTDRVSEFSIDLRDGLHFIRNSDFRINPDPAWGAYNLLSNLVPGSYCNDLNSGDPRLRPLPNERDKDFHLFFVNRIITPLTAADTTIYGAVAGLGYPYAFVSDIGNRRRRHQVIAHEIGHTLYLQHNHERELQPNMGLQNTSTDFWDGSSLMHWSQQNNRRHIGTPHWRELNNNYNCYQYDLCEQ